MNLIELSSVMDVEAELLKEKILTEFQTIILSEYAQINPKIVDALYGNVESATSSETIHECLNASWVDHGKPSTAYSTPMEMADYKVESAQEYKKPSFTKHRVATQQEIETTERLLKSCAQMDIPIIIDTCSVLNPGFPRFYERFRLVAEYTQLKLIVPYLVKEEIAYKYGSDTQLKEVCRNRITFLLSENKKGAVLFVGSEDDRRATRKDGGNGIQADPTLLEKALSYRTRGRNVLLITQDHNLSLDALAFNHFNSFEVKALVLAKKIIQGGALVDNAADAICPQIT